MRQEGVDLDVSEPLDFGPWAMGRVGHSLGWNCVIWWWGPFLGKDGASWSCLPCCSCETPHLELSSWWTSQDRHVGFSV